jgi:hypothetical protein
MEAVLNLIMLEAASRPQLQVERSEPEGNLDGFLARLHDSR